MQYCRFAPSYHLGDKRAVLEDLRTFIGGFYVANLVLHATR